MPAGDSPLDRPILARIFPPNFINPLQELPLSAAARKQINDMPLSLGGLPMEINKGRLADWKELDAGPQ